VAGNVDAGTVVGRLRLVDEWTITLAKANRGLDDAKKKFQRDFGEIDALARRTSTTLMAVGAAGGALGVSFVKAAGEMEQTRMALTSMLKSGEAATRMINDLADFAAKTPFEFKDLTVGTRRLMAFGFEAKQIIPILTAVGDAASAMGGDPEVITRTIRALGQMRSAGRLMTQDMNQLTEVGLPAWQWMADAIGVSTSKIREMTEKGVIPADKAIQALLTGMSGQFGGMMAEQAKTALGMWSNFRDEVDHTKVIIGEAFLPAAKHAISTVNSMLGNLTDEQKRSMGQWVVYGSAVAGSGGVLVAISTGIGTVIRNLKALDEALGVSAARALKLGGAVASVLTVGGVLYAQHLKRKYEREKENTKYLTQLPVDIQRLAEQATAEGTFDAYLQRRKALAELRKRGYEMRGGIPLPIDRKKLKAMGYKEVPGGVAPIPKLPQIDPAKLPPPPKWTGPVAPAPVSPAKRQASRQSKPAAEPFDKPAPYYFEPFGPTLEDWERARDEEVQRAQKYYARLRDEIVQRAQKYYARTNLPGYEEVQRVLKAVALPGYEEVQRALKGYAWLRDEKVQRALRTYLPRLRVPASETELERATRQSVQATSDFIRDLLKAEDMEAQRRNRQQRALEERAVRMPSEDQLRYQREAEAEFWAAAAEAQRRRRERWQSSWGNLGQALWDARRDQKAIAEYGRQAADILAGKLFARVWEGGTQALERSLGGLVRIDAKKNPRAAALSRSLPGVLAAGYSIATGQGGALGGAVSGASIGATLAPLLGIGGPLGIGLGTLAGAIFGGNRDAERRHREAQRAREEMNRHLEQINHALTPVADIFRSAGFDLLPGSATFGGSLDEEISRGPRW